ncbi:MAG: regulatory protein RecX [Clostridia bacterium]|jgi:regulatory protein|nr:regulatory protein RecX [Clostridia bacterium]
MPTLRGLSPMDYALSYLTTRDRTVWEMQTYLETKEFGEADIDRTIDRLKELDLLDDRKFAAQFLKTRLATKPISRAHLKQQLLQHHVSKEDIEEAFCEIPEDAEERNAIELAEKFYRQFASFEPEKRKLRVLGRLQSRGFGYDVCYRALEAAMEESEEPV